MQTPDEWLADFEAKVADLQQKATEFKQAVESSATTLSSDEGDISVTVAPNGALTGLELTDAALRAASGKALADRVMALVRSARQNAADGVAQAFVPLGGDADVVQHIVVAETAVDETAAAEVEPAPGKPRRVVADEEDYSQSRAVYKNDSW
ncbi:YbaB/EbfC family nucleoid-associated protein [Actinokineospora diospyrosa]|uniref:YbaB/EbfC DNA-binding family protein n=1 Tax=Actinokineospora diospyrosa TaxID=103728 RepID=A0ABT1I8I1_9PSEU|nr:YbaB/EbfC family nucleoid-associated protein [Actinokineospora diospyrosa]MCP2268949.1 YbaB/EbfC DNA-binding family protein [Actinokineospora diospyrosa]